MSKYKKDKNKNNDEQDVTHREIKVGNTNSTKNRGELKCCGRESRPCSNNGA